MNHTRRRILAASCASVSLVMQGCAAYSASVKDDEPLPPGEGLVLVFANLHWVGTSRDDQPLLELSYKPTASTFDIRKIHFLKNERMQLVRVTAADYLMTHCFFGFSQLEFTKPIQFSVRPSTITYLGHFEGAVTWPKIGLISDRRLQIVNNEDVAKKSLLHTYPRTHAKLDFANFAKPNHLAKFP